MISIAYALLISIALVLATVIIHYEVLTTTMPLVPRRMLTMRMRVLRLFVGIFFAHLLEIGLYAVAYYLMQGHLGLGTVAGNTAGTVMDFFYFSTVSYTTLGFGDIYPSGPIRIVVGVESLNGLVLIGWSTSYTYLAMQRFSRMARRSHAEAPPNHAERG